MPCYICMQCLDFQKPWSQEDEPNIWCRSQVHPLDDMEGHTHTDGSKQKEGAEYERQRGHPFSRIK